ncbi:MAG TPA: hypothetical protein ENK18_11470, partial [Deltaproteobacteria bacterium]|nr:hypothetical protein [Deltaproteobacteria bacterium]
MLQLVSPHIEERAWRTMVKRSDPADSGRVATHWTGHTPARISAGVLPEVCSRHNSPSRAWAVPHIVHSAGQKGNVGIVLALEEGAHAAAVVLGVARALPTFTSTSTTIDREVRILVRPRRGAAPGAEQLQIVADAVRAAAHLTDQPPSQLGCDALVDQAHQVATGVGASIEILRADELREQGLGGLRGVGQAAAQQPALVVLDHHSQHTPSTAWVGKGVIYDTGGLSIKTKTGMPGMKTDMAGAAAVLAAFEAAVRLSHPRRLTA